MFKLLTLLYSVLFVFSLQSKNFDLSDNKFSINYPKSWRQESNLFSFSILLLGPMKDGVRDIVGINQTGVDNKKIGMQKLMSMKEFKKGRQEWIKKFKGEIIKFPPYKELEWKGIKKSYTFGMDYIVSDQFYRMLSYYVTCKQEGEDRIYHIKSMVRDRSKNSSKKVEKIVRSFACR